ncbi:MAG: hypothetical protein KDD83_12995, partial [Caldilineaceae bacterium]|nr:hypothetical protein [Caldilineaceae bacterium]
MTRHPSTAGRRRSAVTIVLLAAMLLFAGTAHVTAQESQDMDAIIDGMWIDMGLRPQLVDAYNQIARPDDIARAD